MPLYAEHYSAPSLMLTREESHESSKASSSRELPSQGGGKDATCASTCVWLKATLTLRSQATSAGWGSSGVQGWLCVTPCFLVTAAGSTFFTPSLIRARTGCISSQQHVLQLHGLLNKACPVQKQILRARLPIFQHSAGGSADNRRRMTPVATEMPPTEKQLLSHCHLGLQGQHPGAANAQQH